MPLKNMEPTILHVEDDPALAKLVHLFFVSLGFRGNMIAAERVDRALALLDERERTREPVNLILVDMQLPDGTGLDVIREVRANPAWRTTPVIVLSSELAPDTINAAYALGANCYVSKIPHTKSFIDTLRTLYQGWLEDSLLPQASSRDRVHDILSRAIYLRARTAEFYMNLARIFNGKPEMGFWLDRSLNEGNLSNLLAFFLPIISEKDVPIEKIDLLDSMQVQVRRALKTAEVCLQKNPAPLPDEVFSWVLDLIGAMDEEVVAEGIGCLFPKGPEATTALKTCAAVQLSKIAGHIMAGTDDPGLRLNAERLLEWAERLAESPGLSLSMKRDN